MCEEDKLKLSEKIDLYQSVLAQSGRAHEIAKSWVCN